MNKYNKALILGLMVTLAPVCCANDEAQTPAQEQIAQPCCTEDACPVAPVAPEVAPGEQATEATQVVPVETAAPATEVQPEQEMTEEQLNAFLQDLIAELKKEEEAKKKKDAAASQQTEAQPVEAQAPAVQ